MITALQSDNCQEKLSFTRHKVKVSMREPLNLAVAIIGKVIERKGLPYGRVQSVKLLPRGHPSGQHHSSSHHGSSHHHHGGKGGTDEDSGAGGGGGGLCATVAFMDIKSAAKAHDAEHTLEDRALTTEYYEPPAPPSHLPPTAIHVHERAEDVLRAGGPSGGSGVGVGSVVGAGGPVVGGSVGPVGGGGVVGPVGSSSSSGLYAPRSPRFPHGVFIPVTYVGALDGQL
ncbi:hypothetical protein J437_LFUL008236 [Ladona fulva]|uniref:Uncharacterized protein n=1 Tax=Ladona fulva TaxID=123851 RepID=A0A8K0K617_LADFU|nr:hypothetical protein J437_LFUL008236 [Ladona fulva]